MEDILEDLTQRVRQLSDSKDELARRKTSDELRNLIYEMETPEETMQRLIYLNLTNASIRVGLDLKLYNHLTDSPSPLRLDQLAQLSQCDPILLGRVLRHQASLGIIRQLDTDLFAPCKTTRNLAVPEIQSGFIFSNDVVSPSFQALPEFLQQRGYKNPSNALDTPFNQAWKTDLPLWTWLHQRPDMTSHFDGFMKAQRSSVKDMFDYYPFREECRDWSGEHALFVDVGGGTGQQCATLKSRFSDIPGAIVLQDLPALVAKADLPDSVQKMSYDFFTPQPVQSAKYYYFRAIMHDHPDDECVQILRNTMQSMADDSLILLDEIVVPNRDLEWFVTQTDMAMLTQFSSMERTEEQWKQLLLKAGLKLKNILTYTSAFRLSIIACIKDISSQ